MPRVTKRYDLTYSQEQVVVAYIKGGISGSEAAKQIGVDHRQGFVNLLASVTRQWYDEGRLTLTVNDKK